MPLDVCIFGLKMEFWICGFTMDSGSGSINCLYWGAAAPLLFLGGFQPPRPLVGGLQPPAPPRRFLRGSASQALRFVVPRSWHQDLGTKILVPESRYHNFERTSIKYVCLAHHRTHTHEHNYENGGSNAEPPHILIVFFVGGVSW